MTDTPAANGESKETAVATKVGGQVATNDLFAGIDDKLMQQIVSGNQENISDGEVKYSRMAILQPLSPEIASETPGYKGGMIVDNQSRTILSEFGPSPWLIDKGVPASECPQVHYVMGVAIIKLPNEYIAWKNRNTEGPGMKFKTLEAGDPRVRAGTFPPIGYWGRRDEEKGKAPPVTDNTNIFTLLLRKEAASVDNGNKEAIRIHYGPIVATFAKTSKKCGTKLVTALEMFSRTRHRPYWCMPFYLYTKMETDTATNQRWYELHLAQAPTLEELAAKYGRPILEDVHHQCLELARSMTDLEPSDDKDAHGRAITKGRALQEIVINSTFTEEGDDSDTPSFDELMAAESGDNGTPPAEGAAKKNVPF